MNYYNSKFPSSAGPTSLKHPTTFRHDDFAFRGSDDGDLGSRFNIQYSRLDEEPELEIGTAVSTDSTKEINATTYPSTLHSFHRKYARSQQLHVLSKDQYFGKSSFGALGFCNFEGALICW